MPCHAAAASACSSRLHRWRLAAVAAVGAVLCVSSLSASTPADGLGHRFAGGKTIDGGTPHRLIHFTFDDGPDPRTTPRLLDELDELGIKATFFFSASRFRPGARRNRQAPALAREVLLRGHSVGSHSVDHQRMGRLSPAALEAQLDENARLFSAVFGQRTFLFRPPFGSSNRTLDRLLAARQYTNVMWNIGVADWVERPPERLLRTFIRVLARNERERGERGGVVLLHDTHAWSVDGMRLMVAHLRSRNCELLRDPEAELFQIVDDLSPFFRPAAERAPAPEEPLARALSPARTAQVRKDARAHCAAAHD